MNGSTIAIVWLIGALGGDSTPLFSQQTFEEVCRAATADSKPVLVYFSDPSNDQSQAYEEETWQSETVRAWIHQHAHAVEVSSDARPDLQERYDVRTRPTVLLISPEGEVRVRIVGFRDPKNLLKEFDATLKAGDPVELARVRLAADSSNPSALLMYARTLEEAGRLGDALASYARCFELGTASSGSFGGIQLVVIDELGRLSADHPAAHKALRQRRDESRARILGGGGLRGDPAILAASNAWLNDLDDTLWVYGELRTSHPQSLIFRLLRECAVDTALKVKQYDRIPALIDIDERAGRAFAQYHTDNSRALPKGTDEAKFRGFERRSFIERTVRYYEMLLGNNRLEKAEALAAKLIDLDDGAATHRLIAQAGLRSGAPSVATMAHARRALQLSDGDNVEALTTLVKVLLMMDRPAEAVDLIEKIKPEISDEAIRIKLQRLVTMPNPD